MREQLTIPPALNGQVWLYRCHGPARRRMHCHRELEFNLVVSGTAAYIVQETRQNLRAGTLIWLYPDQEHLLVDESPDFAMWILIMRPRALRAVCTTKSTRPLIRTSPTGPICRMLEADDAMALEHLCRHIDTGATSPADPPDPTDTARYNAGLAYMLLEAWRAFDNAERAVHAINIHPAVERAARILRDHDPSLDLRALARRCGLGSDRLARLFRRQIGTSLTDYRNRVRIDRFISLYGRGERINMTAAALDCGFGSYAQFHRVFKSIMACSPADYRRQVRSADRPDAR